MALPLVVGAMLRRRAMSPLTYIKSGTDHVCFRARRVAFREVFILVQPIVALVAGILILVMPRLLNYIVALYLIIVGILGLLS